MRLHVVGLPHTQVTRAFDWCAYTAKIRRLGAMCAAHGHEMILYAGEDCEAVVAEHVPVVHAGDRKRWFGGEWDTTRAFDRWEPGDQCWVTMNKRAALEVVERWEQGDALGVIAGRCQQLCVDLVSVEVPQPLVLEWGVGYEGVLAGSHRAFESESWRAWVYGRNEWGNGSAFDAVIPNAFDPADYDLGPDDGYLLYLGRITSRKGMAIVQELARRRRVVVAGQVDDVELTGVEYRGVVLGAEKRALLAGATAVLVPTLYLEPFGGVAVEAQMSGVPAITSDFGAFPETIEQGVTGWRCSVLGDFLAAVERAPEMRGRRIRAKAVRRFGTKAVALRYDEWFRRCALLYGEGWNTESR